MSNCCEEKACDINTLQEKQSTVLKLVLAINAFMFVVEATAGLIASSTALLADSLDMLGDTLVYGFSLYVLARNIKWQAISALLKGSIMALFGAFVLAEAVHKVMNPVVPIAETIGIVGLLALFLNLLCLRLLWSHRSDDINMRSVWLCSQNDIIANVGVLVAAIGVWYTHNLWPDIFAGLIIAAIFMRSAIHVIGNAARQLLAANA